MKKFRLGKFLIDNKDRAIKKIVTITDLGFKQISNDETYEKKYDQLEFDEYFITKDSTLILYNPDFSDAYYKKEKAN